MMGITSGSNNGKVAPAAFPPPVDSQKEFIKRGLDPEDELIEVGVAIVGGGTGGPGLRQPPAAAARRRPRDDGAPRRSAGRRGREGQDLRRAQPLRRGDAPGAAAGAVPRDDPRAVARGGLRLRRGHQGGGLPAAHLEAGAAHPDAAAVQEPRQRGRLRLGAGPLPAAPGRGGRRLRPHRDRRHAADRRGRRCRRACARATRAAARTASRSATSSPAPTSRRRRTVLAEGCWGHLTGAAIQRVRPRRPDASRRCGSSASRRSGRSPSRWTA